MKNSQAKSIWLFFAVLVLHFSVFGQCIPSGDGNYGLNVKVGELYNLNDEPWNIEFNPASGYNKITNPGATAFPGRSFHILTSVPGYNYGWAMEYDYMVLVDWNSNGSFEDPGETIDHTQNLVRPPFSTNVAVPDDLPLGNYTIRIRFAINWSRRTTTSFTNSCDPATGNAYNEINTDLVLSVVDWNQPENPQGTAEVCVNASFESGDFTGWQAFYGENDGSEDPRRECCPNQGVQLTRHTIVVPGPDPITGGIVQRVPPGGGNFALRLGNDNTGAEAEQIARTFRVIKDRPNFAYSYAIVLNDPGHNLYEQPFFEAAVYDASGRLVPCSRYQVTAGNGVSGFKELNNGRIVYKDWERVFVNLYDYIGQDVTIRFSVGDCSQGAHYGYAYFDAECEPLGFLDPSPKVCRGESVTLEAPDGNGDFAYTWSTGETTREVTFTPTQDTTIMTVSMEPPNGCPIELTDTIILLEPIEAGDPIVYCNADNTYSVEFVISGGSPDTYVVEGATGTFTQAAVTTFKSDPIDISSGGYSITVSDVGACNDILIEGEQTCPISCNVSPIVNAGVDGKLCADGIFEFLDATAIDAGDVDLTVLTDPSKSGIGWGIIDGAGTLSDTAVINPIYTPDPSDEGKTISFYLIGYSGEIDTALCPNSIDTISIDVESQPIVDAGDGGEICSAQTFTVTNSDTMNVAGINWSHSGSGFLENDTSQFPIYHPVQLDFDNGEVVLYLTAIAKAPCKSVQDSLIITFKEDATAYAGEDYSLCVGETMIFDNATAFGGNVLWSSNGEGTFDNDTILASTYTPVEADGGNEVMIILSVTAETPCPNDADTVFLKVENPPTVNAGVDSIICGTDSYVVSDASVEYAFNYIWTHNGAGFLQNNTSINPIYTPGVGDYGKQVQLKISAIGRGICPDASDSLLLDVMSPAVAEAGDSSSVCVGSSNPINNIISVGGVISWAHDGDGIFDDSNLEAPIYTAVESDGPGLVTFIMTVTPDLPCLPVTDTVVMWVADPVAVEAGEDASICRGNSHTFIGASITNAPKYIWTHNGAGILADTNTLAPTYTPGITDLDKTITFYLEAIADAPCESVLDSLKIEVTGKAFAEAGDPGQICLNESFELTGVVYSGASSVMWSHNGGGTLDQSDPKNPIYTPNAMDAGQSIRLILFADADDPCIDDTDSVDFVVVAPPTVISPNDTIICYKEPLVISPATPLNYAAVEWSHNGSGILTDGHTATPTYTATPADAGKILTFTVRAIANAPCSNAMDSLKVEVLGDPVVFAGSPNKACVDVPYTTLDATIENAVGFSWTHDGQGVLSNETTLTPIYTPIDAEAGSVVTLTLTAQALNPCMDQQSTVQLSIIDEPTVDAGSDATICFGESYSINDSQTERSTIINWIHNGTGYIEGNGSLTPVYVPGISDGGKTVVLTVTADPLSPCQNPAVDQMSIAIENPPVLDAGNRITICSGTTHTLNATASSYSTLLWEVIQGNGLLQDPTTLQPTYVPADSDKGTTVILRGTAQGNGTCPPISDELKIRIIEQPEIDAGVPGEICISDLYTLAGTSSNAAEILWTHDGCGVFENAQSLAPTYRPCYEDRNKVVSFQLTAKAASPCLQDVISTTYVRVIPNPGVYAGWDEIICAGEEITLLNGNATNQLDLEWEVIQGDQSKLSDETLMTPTYTSSIDEGGTEITLVAKANPIAPCLVPVTDTVKVKIEIIPEFNVPGGDICPDETFTMVIIPINNYEIQVYDWHSDSIAGRLLHTGENWTVSGKTGTETYWVSPARGCKGARVPVTVRVRPFPEAAFYTDTTLIDDIAVNIPFIDTSLNATTGSWHWGDGNTDGYTPGQTIDHFYELKTGNIPNNFTITLDVESEFGCKDQYIIVIPVKLNWAIYIPNAFSPGEQDDLNEVFKAEGYGIAEYEMWIFNRWGDNIFYSDALSKGWDGRDHIMNGKTVVKTDNSKKMDTYVYKVKVLNVFGESHVYRGEINLIR